MQRGAMAEESINSALRHAQENLRYPIGVAEALGDLKHEFKHSANHHRKIDELVSRRYGKFRRVRGDGNCFYRAVGFAWIEALILRAAAGKATQGTFQPSWPHASSFGDLTREYQDLYQALRFLLKGTAQKAQVFELGEHLIRRLLGDVRFDLCVVVLVRLLVASFLQISQNKVAQEDSELLEIVSVAAAATHDSVEGFVRAVVLPLGQEAEGAVIPVAARMLGSQMRILQLDGSDGQLPDYLYPSEDYKSPLGITIHLLFRPGHYDLLYHSEAFRMRDPPIINAKCSFCREYADLSCPALYVCFHRLCSACAAQVGDRQCPICAEVPPPRAPRPQERKDAPRHAGRPVAAEAGPPWTQLLQSAPWSRAPEAGQDAGKYRDWTATADLHHPQSERYLLKPKVRGGPAMPSTEFFSPAAATSLGLATLSSSAPSDESVLTVPEERHPAPRTAPAARPPDNPASITMTLGSSAAGGSAAAVPKRVRDLTDSTLGTPSGASSAPPLDTPLASLSQTAPPFGPTGAPTLLLPGAGPKERAAIEAGAEADTVGPVDTGPRKLAANAVQASVVPPGMSPSLQQAGVDTTGTRPPRRDLLSASAPYHATPGGLGVHAAGAVHSASHRPVWNMPQTQVLTSERRDVTGEAPKMPLTQTAMDRGRGAPTAKGIQAICHNCTAVGDLRKVSCCSKAFCLTCLADIISTDTKQGLQSKCVACGKAWDVRKIAQACRIEAPIKQRLSNDGYPYVGSHGEAVR